VNPRLVGVLIVWSQIVASCDRAPAEVSASAAVRSEEPAVATSMPHGDHNPRHGGTVYMYKEVHFEVVLSRDGHHRIYFSDATREDLPASVASSVIVTITRPHVTPETVAASIDQQGESWTAEGAAVTNVDTAARVAFVVNDESYWIDIPFVATQPPP
jgi:hypothetical protein